MLLGPALHEEHLKALDSEHAAWKELARNLSEDLHTRICAKLGIEETVITNVVYKILELHCKLGSKEDVAFNSNLLEEYLAVKCWRLVMEKPLEEHISFYEFASSSSVP